MCDSPYYMSVSDDDGRIGQGIPFACGRCPACKRRRVNQWVFRMQQEEKVCMSSYFITLTYATSTVPISDNGFMTLRKKDFQDFMKRLRERERKYNKHKIKYYAVGEYGETRFRPHYHAIIFNVAVVENINLAWNKGEIHVGGVSGASIAYTCKYIDKLKRIPMFARDDRQKEFSLMSKGLGKNYLTPQMIAYHKAHKDINYCVSSTGERVPLSKYYRDRIFTDEEKRVNRDHIEEQKRLRENEIRRKVKKLYGDDVTFNNYMDNARRARYRKFYNNNHKKTIRQ